MLGKASREKRFSIQKIYKNWKRLQGSTLQEANTCEQLAQEALKLGEPLLAFDILASINEMDRTVKGRKTYIQSMIQCGSLDRARDYLESILREDAEAPDLYAMLGRIYKDLWRSQKLEQERLQSAEKSLAAYQNALLLGKGSSKEFYYAINVATTALIVKKDSMVDAMAHLALDLCQKKIKLEPESALNDFWLKATMAEAYLLLFQFDQASLYYKQAVLLADSQVAAIGSMKRQCTLIVNLLEMKDKSILDIFSLPRLGILVGHMIDAPSRKIPRFPSVLVPSVQRLIDDCIDTYNIKIGYAGAASGSDLLFLEAMLNRGNEIIVVLPYSVDVFRQQSVGPQGGEWDKRYERVLREASHIIYLNEDKDIYDDQAHVMTSLYIEGLAKLRAQAMETEAIQIAIWDGVDGGAQGGTSDTIKRWRSQGDSVHIISLSHFLPHQAHQTPKLEFDTAQDSLPNRRKLRAMLFADTVGFSRLKDSHVLLYIEHFMRRLAEVICSSNCKPIATNTWGDGLFLVLDSVEEAGLLSISLQEALDKVEFSKFNLPDYISLRIGLHFGPVFEVFDPIKKTMNVFGSHVSQAARIEPIVPPGSVYASQAFAAQAAVENIKSFTCEYIGQQNLAKQYGSMPIFRISRRYL